MANLKTILCLRTVPGWLAMPLMTLMVFGLVALALTRGDPNRWQDLVVPAILGGLLFLVMAYRLAYLARVERALRAAEQRYHSIYENSIQGIFQTTPQGGFITANPALARMFGYSSPEQLIANALNLDRQFYVGPNRREEFKRILQQNAAVSDFESEVYRKDGSRMWISENALAVRDNRGNLLYYEGTLIDITARRQAEAAMREERNTLRTLIDNLPDRIYVKDLQGRVIMTNLTNMRVCGGKAMEDVVGKTDFEMFPAELASQFWADDQAVLQSGIPLVNREEPGLDAEGNMVTVSTTKVPLRDGLGNIVGLVGIGRGITRQKQAESELRQEHQKQKTWIGELEQRTREIGLLNEMSDLLQSCPTVEEAYGVIAEQGHLLFPTDSGVLYMIGASRNLVESVAAWGPPLADPVFFQPSDCWALRRGRMYHTESRQVDDSADTEIALFCRHIHPPLPTAYTCVPLIAQGETLGVLHLQDRHGSSSSPSSNTGYTQARKQLIHAVADSLGVALSNLRLRESLRQQSIHDPLTGMFNRRYMEESLERELHRSTRLGKPIGVMMLDIDHFKHFNDLSGHDAGDAVLRELGPFLMSRLRAEDIACRYGGEEFALILPDASLETTRQRAEKIREEVKLLQVKYRRQLLASITLSLGVAEFPSHGSSGESPLRAADAALYRAKKGGRDQVRLAKSTDGQAESSRV